MVLAEGQDMDRREFGLGLPALLAVGGTVEGQVPVKAATAELKTLSSGTFKPGPAKTPQAARVSHAYLAGMLKAGNVRLEMHETIQQPGAEHEAVGTHLHNEIWCVQRGTATLYINGTEHTMEAGDVGLVCAGDEHWIKNAGPGELAYFVLAIGPPE
jgi:quercetin dioxygenase-like cupin family protein